MKKTITSDVLNHLLTHGSLTQYESLERYGSWRLAAIICNLRKKGMNIITEPINIKTRYGANVNVAKYILVS